MIKPTTKVALSAVTKLQERLGQVPTHQADEVSKQRAIALLVPQLLAMHAKGYTWRAIASVLSDEGLVVTPTALQGYVRRAHAQDAVAEARGRKGRRGPKPGNPPTHAPAAAAEPTATAAPIDAISVLPREPLRSRGPSQPALPAPVDSAARRPVPSPRRETDET